MRMVFCISCLEVKDMRLCQTVGLPVIDIKDMKRCGNVYGWLMDECGLKAACLLVDGSLWYEGARCIPFESIFALGKDAVLINSAAGIKRVTESKELEKAALLHITGICAPVFLPSGKSLGYAQDFDVNDHGVIRKIILEGEGEIDSNRLLNIGEAILISDAVMEEK